MSNSLNGYAQSVAEEQHSIASTVLNRGRTAVKRAAGVVSQRAIQERSAAALNAAVLRFIDICYERSEYGDLWNLDEEMGRFRRGINPPWTDAGAKAFGLRRDTARHLRRYLRRLQSFDDAQPWLWFYDDESGKWHVNLTDYSTRELARAYWQKWRITAGHLQKLASLAAQRTAK